MAIELGALALAIRDTGGDAVIQKLRVIDGAATKTGAKPVTVRASAPGADQAAAKVRGIGTAAQTASTRVAGLGAQLKTLGGGLVLGAGIGVAMGALAKVGDVLGDSARAFDDAEAAMRRLNAVSKLTGASLADVQRIAREGETTFRLSAAASAELTGNVVKLTAGANMLNASGEFMARWLDLAAANGLTAADAMQALQTTIIGQDEGLNRLGLSNPQQIYEAWAKAAGTTAAKMSDVEKKQAIINEIVAKGSLVAGEYTRSQDTAAGKSALLAQRTEQLKRQMGELLLPLRLVAVSTGTTLVEGFTAAAGAIGGVLTKLQSFRAQIGLLGNTPVVGPAFALLRLLVGDPKAQGKAPEVTWRALGTVAPTPPEAKPAPDAGTAPTAAQLEAERQTQVARQVAAVEAMARLRATDVGTLQAAVRLEAALTAELQRGTASLERRAEIQAQLATLRESGTLVKPLDVRDIAGALPQGPAATLEVPVELRLKPNTDAATEQMDAIGLDLGATLGAALAAGIQQAFQSGNVADGMAAIGAAVLSAIGDMFVQIGVTALAGSKMLAGILKGLATLNPFAMAAAAIGLIAIGAAIKGAASRAVTGVGGGGSGAVSGSRGSLATADSRDFFVTDPRVTGRLPATARPSPARAVAAPAPLVLQVGLVNPSDPASQRLISETVRNAQRRGA